MKFPIPLVGTKGQFKFYTPFNTALNETAVFKVSAVRTISEFLNDNVDVLNIIYLNQGISKEAYDEDLENDLAIVVLQTEGGALYYVPVRFIKTLPNLAGEIYVGKALFVNLGNLPVNLNIDFLTSELEDIIKSVLGVDSKVEIEEITSKFVVPYAQHDVKEEKRKQAISNHESCYSRLFKTQKILGKTKTKLSLLLEKISILEDKLKNNNH